MTEEEARKEAQKIFKEWAERGIELMEQAKKDGTWVSGLDSNRSLFKPLNEEMKEKLELLKTMVEE